MSDRMSNVRLSEWIAEVAGMPNGVQIACSKALMLSLATEVRQRRAAEGTDWEAAFRALYAFTAQIAPYAPMDDAKLRSIKEIAAEFCIQEET